MGSGRNISKGRAWAIVTILVVALIVGLAVGLGFGLHRQTTVIEYVTEPASCADESSARIPKSSPIYSPPTDTVEGKYHYLAAAADSAPCSRVGTEIMVKEGGSAVDAAIAAILCSGVAHPQSCGIGGGNFMTYYNRAENKVYNIMAREMAPAAATERMYVPANVSSRYGGKAIGIPGEVLGLHEAWKLGGKLPWATLFQPAIKLARSGFKVDRLLDKDIEAEKAHYENYPELRNMVTNSETGELYKIGETMMLPKLADTMEKIANEGPNAFYNGSLTADILADINDADGIITGEDLAAYTAALKDPVTFTLSNGYTVYSPPPPSGGAVALLILNILNGFNFTEESFSTVEKTVLTYHRILEAFKHGFAVRSRLGDVDVESDAFKQEMAELLTQMVNPAFGTEKRQKIDDSKTFDTEYYEPAYYNPADAGTSHLSVLGPKGDAVAITSTNNLRFGSKVVGSRTGIVFNDQMDDFSTPGTPNYFGISPSPANFIKPYKRPLSSMSPTVVIDSQGEVKLVTGASGGSRIITSTVLSIIDTLWFNLGLKEALDYPRVHHQLLPTAVRVEERFPQVLLDGLQAKGHNFTVFPDSSCAVQAILQRETEEIYANCDVTKSGIPAGC